MRTTQCQKDSPLEVARWNGMGASAHHPGALPAPGYVNPRHRDDIRGRKMGMRGIDRSSRVAPVIHRDISSQGFVGLCSNVSEWCEDAFEPTNKNLPTAGRTLRDPILKPPIPTNATWHSGAPLPRISWVRRQSRKKRRAFALPCDPPPFRNRPPTNPAETIFPRPTNHPTNLTLINS
jgi:hypothetical protein